MKQEKIHFYALTQKRSARGAGRLQQNHGGLAGKLGRKLRAV